MHRRALTILLLVAAVLSTVVAPAGAAKKPTAAEKRRQAEIREQIQSLKEQVQEASAEESELLGKLDAVQDRRRDLDARVGELDAQINSAQAEVDAAEAQLESLQAEFVLAQTKLQVADGKVAEAKRDLRDKAVAAYIGQPSAHAANVMLTAGSMRDLAAAVGYLDVIVSSQKRAVERYAVLREETVALRAAAEATKDQAMSVRNDLLRRKSELEAARQEQDSVRQQVLSHEQAQASLVNEVRSRKSEFYSQIAALKQESDAISGLLRGVQGGQVAGPSGKGVLSYPIPGARVTSNFGPRVHPITHEVRNHDGIDVGAGHGTPIRAAGDGVVFHAGPRGGYGNTIIVDHGNALATLYAHQSSFAVGGGERVARGQIIGFVGSTGFSTGPHLHFEVRLHGTPVDPMQYL